MKNFFIGFILGNIFGNFVSWVTILKAGNLSILAILIFWFEGIYKLGCILHTHNIDSNVGFLSIQIGILMGFFVDAYKVGS